MGIKLLDAIVNLTRCSSTSLSGFKSHHIIIFLGLWSGLWSGLGHPDEGEENLE